MLGYRCNSRTMFKAQSFNSRGVQLKAEEDAGQKRRKKEQSSERDIEGPSLQGFLQGLEDMETTILGLGLTSTMSSLLLQERLDGWSYQMAPPSPQDPM
ncbi:hypothetical protein AMTR_s00009p00244270 [Amborella trichopoda]|uniref:Uncharacterized protein n=1 Tax=Amborella trichopoda TaxID=13333 RepID=W1NGV6_AMBTC|nr:hypothetical protein AMTR_s00009p00244270 [Amborella trichopoda]